MPGCALPGTPLADALPESMHACTVVLSPGMPTYLNLEDETTVRAAASFSCDRCLRHGQAEYPSVSPTSTGLGCRACEPVCPTLSVRPVTRGRRAPPSGERADAFIARLILFVFAREWLLRPAIFFSRILAPTRFHAVFRIKDAWLCDAMLASTGRSIELHVISPRPARARNVALLRG